MPVIGGDGEVIAVTGAVVDVVAPPLVVVLAELVTLEVSEAVAQPVRAVQIHSVRPYNKNIY